MHSQSFSSEESFSCQYVVIGIVMQCHDHEFGDRSTLISLVGSNGRISTASVQQAHGHARMQKNPLSVCRYIRRPPLPDSTGQASVSFPCKSWHWRPNIYAPPIPARRRVPARKCYIHISTYLNSLFEEAHGSHHLQCGRWSSHPYPLFRGSLLEYVG